MSLDEYTISELSVILSELCIDFTSTTGLDLSALTPTALEKNNKAPLIALVSLLRILIVPPVRLDSYS
jgi:hypothetical protein